MEVLLISSFVSARFPMEKTQRTKPWLFAKKSPFAAASLLRVFAMSDNMEPKMETAFKPPCTGCGTSVAIAALLRAIGEQNSSTFPSKLNDLRFQPRNGTFNFKKRKFNFKNVRSISKIKNINSK